MICPELKFYVLCPDFCNGGLVGADNVVQVVTDNASNNMGAKTMLKNKRPKIFLPHVQHTP